MFNPTRAVFLAALVMTSVLHGAISADGAQFREANASLDKVQKNPAYTSGNFSGQEAKHAPTWPPSPRPLATATGSSVSSSATAANRSPRHPGPYRYFSSTQFVKAALANSGQSSTN